MGLIIDTTATIPNTPAAGLLRQFLLRSIGALALLMAAAGLHAQVLDDLDVRREGADAVLQLRFVTPVQYLRSVLAKSGDQAVVFYRVLPTRQTLELATTERRLPPRADGLPAVTVTDESTAGAEGERRLLIRLAAPMPLRVRAGRGGRSVELVLEGRGALVGATLPAAAAVTPAAAAPAAAAAPTAAPGAAADAELDRRAAGLLATARESMARGDSAAAIESLSTLLELPPTGSSREAQALIGQARLKAGDSGRARAEFEAFLRLYPSGADADEVRKALAALSPGEPARGPGGERRAASTTTLNGSVSSTYYGGQSKVRTQEFQDSPLSGLPELVTLPTLAATDQKQLVSSVDMNWRHRDAEVDQRAVFRDSYTRDFLRSDKTKNKLSALYFDQRSLKNGTSFRVGRQSPLGGGVLGRFDGVQAGYAFKPRWKASVVAGAPTDTLLDTRRRFYGASVEAEALTPQFGGSLYLLQQTIDGEVDRRAIGSDMRYFDGGLSGTAQIDYDVMLKGLNVASLQGTWQRPDNTVFNLLYDRRNTPMLMLGNTLFFTDPNLALRPTRLSELLQTTTVQALRDRARATTAVSTQAALGVTTPLSPQWQVGGDLRYTSTGAVAPVPDILPTGLPASGSIWSASLQLIGTNLSSLRDTHVLIVNLVRGPTFQGQLLSYNNASLVAGLWQVEPSLKLYRQSDNLGTHSSRWSPGLRVSYRVVPQAALESEVNVENSKTTGPTRNESSTRTFFYVGGRYDF
jgi:tetratricopeptide (TPR) repeat protein